MAKREILEYPGIGEEEVREALDFCCRQICHVLPEFTHKFQNAYSVGGFYEPVENWDWTCGFWTGEIWLAYEHCGETALKEAALVQVQDFMERIRNKRGVDHHDMGFLYTPSCVAAYKLAGSREGREAALMAADQLVSRFQPVGEFIQAWGAMGAPENYRLIIDCLLNLPLLYWASRETGNPLYRDTAEKHIRTTVANVVREDDSTWHTFYFDKETGAPDHGATCQGYKDASAWARGQAWGIYGTAIAYKNTGRAEYIEYFKRVSRYFLSHLPDDICPFWDLSFGNGDGDQPRDSSSSAIAACGFLEMSKYLPDEDAAFYTSAAQKLLASLIRSYQVTNPAVSNGQLLHGVYAKSTPYNTCKNAGVDECVIWGDYFFMEALTRLLKPDWNIYW